MFSSRSASAFCNSGVFPKSCDRSPIRASTTQAAVESQIGTFRRYFIAIFFAFTSIIGNYSYPENARAYLTLDNLVGLTALRCGVLGMVMWGTWKAITTVFNAADAAMGPMAAINLIAIVLLSKLVVKLILDYFAQRAAGRRPEFNATDYPELADQIDASICRARKPE